MTNEEFIEYIINSLWPSVVIIMSLFLCSFFIQSELLNGFLDPAFALLIIWLFMVGLREAGKMLDFSCSLFDRTFSLIVFIYLELTSIVLVWSDSIYYISTQI